jgi:hypothetical protein
MRGIVAQNKYCGVLACRMIFRITIIPMIYALAIFADMTRYFSQYSLSVARVWCTGTPTAATLMRTTEIAATDGCSAWILSSTDC